MQKGRIYCDFIKFFVNCTKLRLLEQVLGDTHGGLLYDYSPLMQYLTAENVYLLMFTFSRTRRLRHRCALRNKIMWLDKTFKAGTLQARFGMKYANIEKKQYINYFVLIINVYLQSVEYAE